MFVWSHRRLLAFAWRSAQSGWCHNTAIHAFVMAVFYHTFENDQRRCWVCLSKRQLFDDYIVIDRALPWIGAWNAMRGGTYVDMTIQYELAVGNVLYIFCMRLWAYLLPCWRFENCCWRVMMLGDELCLQNSSFLCCIRNGKCVHQKVGDQPKITYLKTVEITSPENHAQHFPGFGNGLVHVAKLDDSPWWVQSQHTLLRCQGQMICALSFLWEQLQIVLWW